MGEAAKQARQVDQGAPGVRALWLRASEALRLWRTETLSSLPGKVKHAAPTSAFFIALFWIVVATFGVSHVLPVSAYTTLFNVRLRKYNRPAQYARFFLVSLLALVAARLATLNVLLCVALNLAMPFVFVFMRSSQLNPRRYFPYMMLFVFLQLRPEFLGNLPQQAALLGLCCTVLTAALIIAGKVLHKDHENIVQLHENIRRLADALQDMADHGIGPRTRPMVLRLRADFSDLAYTVREDASVQPVISNLHDMFAMLAQRTAYLVGRLEWHEGSDCPNAPYLRELADLTRAVDQAINFTDNRVLAYQGSVLLKQAPRIENDRFRLFFRSYLHMLILILHDAADPRHHAWHLSTANQLRVASFRKHPSLDSFELRFTIRCGVIMAVSCAAALALPVDHLYWFPLTAFLLTQPWPTESIHRMRTRTAGTVLGCVVVHGLSLLNLPYEAVMVLGMVFITCLYSSKPGGTVIAFFATVYALSMASVSIGDRYAIWMRLACLAASVALVLAVNRVVVPTSDRTLFLANVRQLFSLLERYWELLRKSVHADVDVTASSEALLHFQMVHSQAAAYARGLPERTDAQRRVKAATRRALFCLWELACELEQLGLLIRTGEVEAAAFENLELFMVVAENHCVPFAYDERMKPAEQLASRFADEDLRYVLEQYLRRARSLAEALDEARDLIGERPSYMEEVRDAA